MVRTLRCGRSNPGSTPGPGIILLLLLFLCSSFYTLLGFVRFNFYFLLYKTREQEITKEYDLIQGVNRLKKDTFFSNKLAVHRHSC